MSDFLHFFAKIFVYSGFLLYLCSEFGGVKLSNGGVK